MKVKSFLKVASVNLVLTLVLVEAASVVSYFMFYDSLFYTRSTSSTGDRYRPPAPERKLSKIFHPYLGLINPPGQPIEPRASDAYLTQLFGETDPGSWKSLQSNDYGFFSHLDYPYRPAPDEFVVVVLGGSVAQYFALQGGERLGKKLQAADATEGKRPVVLNMAQGGMKAPQQLHVLTHFLTLGQPMDLVINIDGHNEVAASVENHADGIHISMPSSTRLLPLISLIEVTTNDRESLTLFGEIERQRRRMERADVQQRGAVFASAYWFHWLSSQRVQNQINRLLDRLDAKPGQSELVYVDAASGALATEDLYESIAALWSESSLMAHQILSARKIPYVHVLQPSQYVTNHPFTAEERMYALDPDDAANHAVREGIPHLLERMDYLREHNVSVMSALDIFDEEIETVFADTCCHLNRRGNEFLVDEIARFCVEVLGGVEIRPAVDSASQ